MKFINQMEPSFDDNERNALNNYMLQGGWGTEFKKTREFEDMIREYTGAEYCWIMPNGTLSLTCALIALGIASDDEVIVPDFTMVATANAVRLAGAKVIFADIERRTLCMDVHKMKDAISEKTKAVILVSINGRYTEDIEMFIDICKSKGIYLIEDAAQSLGSFHKGKHIGTFGEIGSFSFSAPKIITTGQGGALITNNAEIHERIKRIRDFGRDRGGEDHYLSMGWNLKFTDFQAVIGIEQMKKLPNRVVRKKEMGKLYFELLKEIEGIELLQTNFDEQVLWFFDILCDRRDELIEYLKRHNIGTREFYPALHSEPVYNLSESYPVSEEISKKGLWLPSSIELSDDEIKNICNCICEFYAKN